MVWSHFTRELQIGFGYFLSTGDKGIVLRIGNNFHRKASRLFQQTGKGLWCDIGAR
jgi:hypothetical protein